MKIATDRETIVAIRPIHNACAALRYRPGRAIDQYACGGKKILLILRAGREPYQKNSARTGRTSTAQSNADFVTTFVPSTAT